MRLAIIAFLLVFSAASSSGDVESYRQVISLNGEWEVAEGEMDKPPTAFDHRVPVPGLIDMAMPSFEEVGKKSDLREAFWYRREFKLEGAVPKVARLKINKAKFSAQVWLNNQLVGEHFGCFTPGWFNVQNLLRGSGGENILLVRIGAFTNAVPSTVPTGFDFEKSRYFPGIYDDVSLILSGTPYIQQVQIAPCIEPPRILVQTTLINVNEKPVKTAVSFKVREARTGKLVTEITSDEILINAKAEKTFLQKISLPKGRLWLPETPFLYWLEVFTEGDCFKTRFGLREFRFDSETKRAYLNGRPYYLRGTNVCIFRFFEDPVRDTLPWDKEWVRKLHSQTFKSLHWNAIRYCIGPPPEFWYDIADESGFLIQNEFPLWYTDRWPKDLSSEEGFEELKKEFTEWMQTSWNHPCVVLWDAQNETHSKGQTAQLISEVRSLDLSARPWENGWDQAEAENDPCECHAYLYQNLGFKFSDVTNLSDKPFNLPPMTVMAPNYSDHPLIINEYGWLWLNRDGTPTTLSKGSYKKLLGENPSSDELRETYAYLLGALTELWRCRRNMAGILEFCSLGYSRKGGATSDHFIDVKNQILEPHMASYLKHAFSPVGLLLDEWEEEFDSGEEHSFKIIAINDLAEESSGRLRIRLVNTDGVILDEKETAYHLDPFGAANYILELTLPDSPGHYQAIASLIPTGQDKVLVVSRRKFKIE